MQMGKNVNSDVSMNPSIDSHAEVPIIAASALQTLQTRFNMQIMSVFISHQAFLCVLLEEKDPILQCTNDAEFALSKICCKARH